MDITIYTDGGSRGNPGPSAWAYTIEYENKKITNSGYLGITTNNVAEYTALIHALKNLMQGQKDKTCEEKIQIYMDSELIVKQLNGIYKIKDSNMKQLSSQVKEILTHFPNTDITHIPREKNKEADKLVNEVLDSHS